MLKRDKILLFALIAVACLLCTSNYASAQEDTTAPRLEFVNATSGPTNIKTIKIKSDENLSKALLFVADYYNGDDFERGVYSGSGGAQEDWTIDSSTASSGHYSLKSQHERGSWAGTNLSVDSTTSLYFYCKVASQLEDPGWDPNSLDFYLDGKLQDTISGNVDWRREKYVLSSGSHDIKLVFIDGMMSPGDKNAFGWVDDFYLFNEASATVLTTTTDGTSTVAEFTPDDLPQGVNYYQVLVADEAGNETISRPYGILNYDNIAPVTTTLSDLPESGTSSTETSILVGGDDVGFYKYKLDGAEYGAEFATSTRIELLGLSSATHTISVLGRDIANNWQTEPATYSWLVVSTSTDSTSTDDTTDSGGGSGGGGSGGSGGGGGGGSGFVTPPVIVPTSTTTTSTVGIINDEPVTTTQKVLGVKLYADGSLIRSIDTFRIYLLIDGQKKYISTLKELKKYKNKKMYQLTNDEISSYPDYRPNGTLLRSPDYKIFVINSGKKKHITSLQELKSKYRGKPIINVGDGVIEQYPNG